MLAFTDETRFHNNKHTDTETAWAAGVMVETAFRH